MSDKLKWLVMDDGRFVCPECSHINDERADKCPVCGFQPHITIPKTFIASMLNPFKNGPQALFIIHCPDYDIGTKDNPTEPLPTKFQHGKTKHLMYFDMHVFLLYNAEILGGFNDFSFMDDGAYDVFVIELYGASKSNILDKFINIKFGSYNRFRSTGSPKSLWTPLTRVIVCSECLYITCDMHSEAIVNELVKMGMLFDEVDIMETNKTLCEEMLTK